MFLIYTKRLRGSVSGSVTMLGALSLPVLAGMIGFGVELSNGYAERVANQSVADMAALAAANVYLVNKSESEMRGAAREIASGSGLAADSVDVSLVDSPDASGVRAVKAVVTTDQPYFFSRVFGLGTSFAVGATAFAKLPPASAPCIIALAEGASHGVSATGGSGISAPDCAIWTNSDAYAEGGSSISAKAINAHGAIHTPPYDSSIQADQKTEGAALISDPLSGNADMIAARNMIGTVTPVQVPTLSAIPAVGISAPSAQFQRTWWPDNAYIYSNGGTSVVGVWDGSAWVFPGGTYDFDSMSVTENVAFSGPTTINVRNNITGIWPGITIRGNGTINAGGSIQNAAAIRIEGDGTINTHGDVSVVGGGTGLVITGSANLNVGGSVTNTGAGFWLGNGGSANVAIAGNLTVSGSFMAGSGNFAILGRTTLQGSSTTAIGTGRHYFGPIDTQGATSLTVGDGDTDINGKLNVGDSSSVRFGNGAFAVTKDSWGDGNAILTGGSSTLIFGHGPFSANGNIQAAGTVTFGATASHYINGDLTLSSSAVFGSGAYYIAGNFHNTTTGSMTGTDVSFILSGDVVLSGSAHLALTAPTGGGTGAIKDFLFITDSSGATVIEGGGNSVLAGIIYVPNSALTVRSGGQLSGGGKCWSLVAQTVTVFGGAGASTSSCSPLSSSGSGSSSGVSLVR